MPNVRKTAYTANHRKQGARFSKETYLGISKHNVTSMLNQKAISEQNCGSAFSLIFLFPALTKAWNLFFFVCEISPHQLFHKYFSTWKNMLLKKQLFFMMSNKITKIRAVPKFVENGVNLKFEYQMDTIFYSLFFFKFLHQVELLVKKNNRTANSF